MPGNILDLYCIQLSNAGLFCKNYAKLYYDAKHLEYALHALICSKKHIFANEQKRYVGKLRS